MIKKEVLDAISDEILNINKCDVNHLVRIIINNWQERLNRVIQVLCFLSFSKRYFVEKDIFKFLKILEQKKEEYEYLSSLKKLILNKIKKLSSNIAKYDSCSMKIKFLYFGYKEQYFTFDEMYDILKYANELCAYHVAFLISFYFIHVFSDIKHSFLQTLKKNFEPRYGPISKKISRILLNIDHLIDDDYKKLRDICDYGYVRGTIEYFIKYDMAKEFINNYSGFDMCTSEDGKRVSVKHLIVRYGAIKCFKYLLTKSSEWEDVYNDIFVSGHVEILNALVINTDMSIYIHTACIYHHYGIIQYILDNSIDNNSRLVNELLTHNKTADFCIFRIFLEEGGKVSRNLIIYILENQLLEFLSMIKHYECTYIFPVILFEAFNISNNELIKFLLSEFCYNINIRDQYDECLLHKAVTRDNYELVEILVKYDNIDINMQNKQGNTPLHVGILRKSPCVKLLINDERIDMNISNKHKQTPSDLFQHFLSDESASLLNKT